MPIDPIDKSGYTNLGTFKPDLTKPDTDPYSTAPKALGGGLKKALGTDAAGRSAVIGESALELSAQHQTVQAAVAFHLGNRIPGIEWGNAINPIADRFLEMTQGNPQLTAALQEDVNTLFALTDTEIAERIMRGETASQFGDVFDAIAEVAWEVGATELANELEKERADAISGTFDGLTGTEALTATLPADQRNDPSAVADLSGADPLLGRTFETLFDVPGAWSFSPAAGVLAVTVGDETIGIETRPGFEPESHLDVMAEVVSAQANGRVIGGDLTPDHGGSIVESVIKTAHSLGSLIENDPGAQRALDMVWGMGIEEAQVDVRNEKNQITEESVSLAAAVPFPDEAMIASIARVLVGESEGAIGSRDALTAAADLVAEERDTMLTEFRNLTSDEILEQLEADAEGRSAFGEAFEGRLEDVLEVFETWDQISQQIGIRFMDVWKDAGLAVYEGAAGDWEAGFEQLGKVLEAPEANDAGEYFGLEGGAADAANLINGGIFDPFNLVFPGAKGVRAIAAKALTDPKYARIYLRMGSYPSVIRSIVGDTSTGILSRFRSNLDDVATKVVDDSIERFADVTAANAAIDDVVDVLGPNGEVVARANADILPPDFASRLDAGDTLDEILESQRTKIAYGVPEYSNPRGVRVASSLSGMDDTDMIALVRLANDPTSTREQVEDVFIRAMSKDYLGEGPMRAQRHSTVEGVGRMLESIAGDKIDDETMTAIIQMFSKLSVGRTFRLGENHSLDALADLLTQFYPRDSEAYTRFFTAAVERRAAASDELALKGTQAAVLESARRELWQSGGTISSVRGGDDLRGINQNLTQIEEALSQVDGLGVDDAAKAQIRTQLEQTHGLMSRRVRDAEAKLGPAKANQRSAKKQIDQATYLEGDLANAARNQMARVTREIYEDMAQRLNAKFGEGTIPVIKGRVDPLAPDVPVRDWSAVTGLKRNLAGDDQDLRLWMGLAVDDVDISRGLDAVGMFNRSQKVLLPASPYEVVLFERIAGNPKALAKAAQALRNERVKKVVGAMKFAFAVNLLVNPLTAGKITLDETLRFLADTGQVGQFLRSTAAGMPLGIGRVSENIFQKFSKSVPNPWAGQYRRNVGGWSADDYANYDWVVRPERRAVRGQGAQNIQQYVEQAERWVNGTLLNDSRFQEYARWVDTAQVLEDGRKIPPQGFIDWWETGPETGRPGKAEARETLVTIRDEVKHGYELTATEAFNIIDNAFEHWVDLLVDPKQQNAMRRALKSAATTPGGKIDPVAQAHLLKSIKQVPGLSGKTGPGTAIFNIFFGAPSGRRAGVFFEHYFDEAIDILKTRHGERVLTVERVMEETGATRETAQYWLKQGADNQTISQLVRQKGYRTESQLEARAAAYAERRADDLMYRFTASSLAGRGVEAGLLFPFARAQMDFLSWWTDHLTKPMTLRIPLEVRAKLPAAANKAISAVERVPVNLRALGKYSHLVAGVNNEYQDSPLDQMIDNLTFFPFHYDSEFLLDVSPQFGALPSWMFDVMVDRGVFDDETVDAIETLFPALGFTEVAQGGVLEEVFDRVLPTSLRALRGLAGSSLRRMYALFGEDIHRREGLDAQIVNALLSGKVPAATGDFQVALAADFFASSDPNAPGIFDVVPGSDEFNEKIRELAVKGAVEANRQEWNQDLKDRVSPLTGYDAEFRALRAYEGMFDEEVFSLMSSAGLFQTNDLLENEQGIPRVKAIWDDYLDGKATTEALTYLRDALTTAYFDAGRVDVFPGFSYQDYLHLIHPEMSVNLIAKNEDSGIPVVNEDHAEFRNNYINRLNGRLQNVPPGPEGAELVADARRKGWLVNRPMEATGNGELGWAFDAAAAVYKSGSRAVHGVWEWVSHKPWSGRISQSLAEKSFVLGEKESEVLGAAGLDITAGTRLTYGEFFNIVDDFDERFDVSQPFLSNTLRNGAVHGQLALHSDEFGQGLLDDLDEADLYYQQQGLESIDDWPEESKQAIRDRFAEAITLGYTTLRDYSQEIEPIFGPIDYTPPTPPPVAELEGGIRVEGDDLQDLSVIDGDTISILLDDGPMRVRLIGINAPEATQGGYGEARDNLMRVIAEAEEIVFGIYKPELFGVTQLSAPGERRLLAWLYIDGTPVFDPSVFTADNPRGAGVGGNVLDLESILEAGAQ